MTPDPGRADGRWQAAGRLRRLGAHARAPVERRDRGRAVGLARRPDPGPHRAGDGGDHEEVGIREGYGVLIAQVMKETPAEASGLREGDLVVAIDGRPIVETRALQRLVGATPAGRELGLIVLRERDRQEVRVRVGRMPAEAVADRVAFEFGFYVRDVARSARPGRRGVGVPWWRASPSGALPPAAGLLAGDRIMAVNDVAVETVEDFRREIQDLYLRDTIRLRVERKGEPVDVHPAARAAGEPVMKRLHILVVEDDETLRDLLGEVLRGLGIPDGRRVRPARGPSSCSRRSSSRWRWWTSTCRKWTGWRSCGT